MNKDDNRNGLYEERYDNGQLSWRCTLKDGKTHGLREEWFDNGQLHSRATYKNGKANGLFEFWNRSGRLFARAIYKMSEYIKSLPTDVSLQELVNRGELDKKYLYDEDEV